MNIMILGAAGFIGTNLTMELAKNSENKITLVDMNLEFFKPLREMGFKNVEFKEFDFANDEAMDSLVRNQDYLYHLVSSTVPSTSNLQISQEIQANVVFTAKLLESCVKEKVKRVCFISSGGTVYGKEANCPLPEETPTYPINSYGLQKITIEKLFYLYHYMYGLDYRIVRLANPYGPYQRPNGVLGAVTTFTYKALNDEVIEVYGDGSVVRDFIYIDDAIRGILTIMQEESQHKTFNLGSGKGTSIVQVLETIGDVLGKKLNIVYKEARKVDVPVNYLDISRYETELGKLNPISLSEGVSKTAEFMKNYYAM